MLIGLGLARRSAGRPVGAGIPVVAGHSPVAGARADFYVYPTVSTAKRLNAPLVPLPKVVAVARAQAAQFAAHCRLFVPVCRQITETALLSGKYTDPKATATAYGDVQSAWDDYLRNAGQHILCVDPTQLLGERGRLHPLLPSSPLIGSAVPGDVVPGSQAVTTGFAGYPDALTARCSTAAGASVLHVSGGVAGHPVAQLQQLGPAWGLHVADVNLALGDLVQLVGREAKAWRH